MSDVSERLLPWYDAGARDFPWRKPPGTGHQEPYRAWLAEVMLQQTTTAAVVPYYEAFLRRWPTVDDLAAAPDAEVMEAWAGLGYYARARNLLAAARAVSVRGGFPETSAELRALPGFGPYTSAAVAAIAFGERVAVVDANIKRVFHRLRSDRVPAPDKEMAASVLAATPHDRPGDFAQALMDLGARVCRPKNPRCEDCPLTEGCLARAAGDPENFPEPKVKAAKPKRNGTVWVARRGDEVLTIRRPDSGLLGGTLAFPSSGWDGSADPEVPDAEWVLAGTVKHTFTHFEATLDVLVAEVAGDAPGWRAVLKDGTEFPTLMRKAFVVAKGST